VDGNCPIHGIPVQRLKEENYFFPLSRYQEPLLRLYEERPEFILPEVRRNEIVSFVKGGLQDLSISRSGSSWGIPVPWDTSHVIYVWVDALLNYITAPGFGADEDFFEQVWPCDLHVIGKDITRFHAVIWPALLMAAGLEVPRTVFGHGFISLGGEKMSKSRGTGLHPRELLDHFGVDSYRYYFMREIQFGADGNFSWESMTERHNADLANGLGNLASRVLAMLGSSYAGQVPEPGDAASGRIPSLVPDVVGRVDAHMEGVELSLAIAAIWELVDAANKYLVETEPWALAKDADRRDELGAVLYTAAETLRILAVLISPAMPQAAARLWSQLGLDGDRPLGEQRLPDAAGWGGLPPGTQTAKGSSLFPRLDR
jgi:methionyl-tRNA synthetase